jgi:putative ABC transport system ATP-binding protein
MVYGQGPAACRALTGVSLDVHPGEVLALMGPSGSGKTTLISIIGGLLTPTEGRVRVLGHDLAGLGKAALAAFRLAHIGFVFQGYNLFPALSAEENVRVALDLKGRSRAEAAGLLSGVGLADKRRAFPGQLSGGQKQRVAIARALAGDPPVLLADEPTAALDSQNGRAVMALMKGLAHSGGRAVIVVSHDPRVLEAADRVATISDGMITS